MGDVTIKVSDFRKLIAESSNEFKAKIGDGVESGNKTNAGKAYSDAKKRAKDFDGGGKEGYWKGDAKYSKDDYNGTTLDYEPENADENYKKRVHAQAKGYTSEAEMNNKIDKVGDFDDNENIYQGIKKSGQEKHKKVKQLKKSGLQASKLPDEFFDKKEMYESVDGFNMRGMIDTIKESTLAEKPIEQDSVKTVHFKRTQFLNEEHMRTRIPDEFKKEGCTFKMKDCNDNTYLLEWRAGKANVLEHTNKEGMNESKNRMMELMNYKSSDTETGAKARLTENDAKFENTLNRVRGLMK